MNFLNLDTDYKDPSLLPIEIVERKGVGHPDSLADALANEVSIKFSNYCLNNFGCVLHHNVDKLYIGGGHFINNFGFYEKIKPVIVQTNGRMSNVFGDLSIDIESIQKDAISSYLFKVMPLLKQDDVVIVPNASQCTKVPYWYTPRGIDDIPDATEPKANDTSFCVSSWPPTPSEVIAYNLERYFWSEIDGLPIPRFPEIGQDIKVLVLRKDLELEVTLCVPTISTFTNSFQEYKEIIGKHESNLQRIAEEILHNSNLKVSVNVNQYQKLYMLGVGSCIECGEEGLVGRGNSINGIISSHRIHTQESWAGKNPVYHTGRVLGYLTQKLARVISTELGVKCTVSSMTRAGDSLIPPRFLGVSTDKQVDLKAVEKIVEENLLEVDYLKEILSFRPWMMKL